MAIKPFYFFNLEASLEAVSVWYIELLALGTTRIGNQACVS